MIISAFPGTGKSYFYNKYKNKYKILDSDSSRFSWISDGVRNPDFPNNYINHIWENKDKVDVVLVSSHKVVRDQLFLYNLNYTLIYPRKNLKNLYLENYTKRGSNRAFIDFMDENWNTFLDELDKEYFPIRVILPKDLYIEDFYFNRGRILYTK